MEDSPNKFIGGKMTENEENQFEEERKPIQIKVNEEREVKIQEKKEPKPEIKEFKFKPLDILTILTIILAMVGLFVAGVSYGHIDMCEANGGEGIIGGLLSPWDHECEFEPNNDLLRILNKTETISVT